MNHPLANILSKTDPRLAGVVGDVASATAQGAAIETGIVTGLDVAATAATTAGAGAVATAIGATTGTVAAISGAIGSAIPIPGIGAAIAALAALITALAGSLKDTFHPSKGVAAAWLWLFRAMPELTMLNVDRATSPIEGANLVRYFRIVSGEIPKGVKGNNGNLNNPHISTSCDNPYQCSVDKDEPLTDPAYLKRVLDAYHAWIPTMGPGANQDTIFDNWMPLKPQQAAAMRALPKKIPSPYNTPKKARAIIHVFRSLPKSFKAISGWSEFTANRPQIREHVRHLRELAGETKVDKILNDVFGGDVTPGATHHGAADVKVGEAPPAAEPAQATAVKVAPCPPRPSRLAWFGLGALTLAGSLVGLTVWQVRKAEKAIKAGEGDAIRRIRSKNNATGEK